jgi:hypothetical protein
VLLKRMIGISVQMRWLTEEGLRAMQKGRSGDSGRMERGVTEREDREGQR